MTLYFKYCAKHFQKCALCACCYFSIKKALAILGFALTEAIALFALMMAFLILFTF